MAKRTLYTRRLLCCQIAEARCGVCGTPGKLILFDADLLARVCLPCGEDLGVAEIALSSAPTSQPGNALIRLNP